MKFNQIMWSEIWNTDHADRAVTQGASVHKTVCIEMMKSFYVTFDRPVTKTLPAVLNYVALSYDTGT